MQAAPPSSPPVPVPAASPAAADPWAVAWRIVLLATCVVVGIWLLVTLRDIVLLVLVATILATGLGPVVDRLQRAGIPRWAGVLLIYLVLIVGLILVGLAVVPPVIGEIEAVVEHAPEYSERAVQLLQDLGRGVPALSGLDEEIVQDLRGLGSQIGAVAVQALSLVRFAVRLFGWLLNAILVLLITLYLIVDGERVRSYLLSFLPPRRRAHVMHVTSRMGQRMGGWLVGQITLSAVVGLVSFLGLSALGVNGVVLLAVIAGIGEAIPIVGPIASAVPAVIVAAFESPVKALLVAGLYLLIQQLENNLLVPKIMERAVNLHPLAVVLSLVVGSELLGVAGAIVAVPTAAAVAVLLDEVRRERALAALDASAPA